MKVILGCDPLLMPLTGIGHYTKQLGQQLLAADVISSLKLYAHGRFFDHDILTAEPAVKATKVPMPLSQQFRLRLAQSEIAVRAYEKIMPALDRWQLAKVGDHVVHSPNFHLPDFAGKKVVTIHDLSTLRFPEFHPSARVHFVNNAIKRAIAKADHIITDSELVRAEIIEHFNCSPDRLTAIPLAARADFRPRNEAECVEVLDGYGIAYRAVFLFVATFEPRKNITRMLNAYLRYRENCPDGYDLVMFGSSGWHEQSFASVAETLIKRGWLKTLGYVPDSHVPVLMSSARALLFPSVYEGFGLPVLEAMQSATPVITSKDSAMAEISGDACMLCDPFSETDIASTIEKMASPDTDLVNLVARGQERAAMYSWASCASKTLNVYRALQ